MPKASIKTKGTSKDGLKDNSKAPHSVLPVAASATSNNMELSVPELNSDTSKRNVKKINTSNNRKKTKRKISEDGICQSKQLKDKSALKIKRRKIQPKKITPTETTYDSDDDKPLAVTSSRLMVTPSTSEDQSISNMSASHNISDILNIDQCSTPKKNKNLEIISPFDTEGKCNQVAYTSVIKSASILLIKKQSLLNDDGCSPIKRIQHSVCDEAMNIVQNISSGVTNNSTLSKEIDMSTSLQIIAPPIVCEDKDNDNQKYTMDEKLNIRVPEKDFGNNDSDSTEPYDYNSISPTNGSSGRSFSPIPSTSKDTEAFEKNDQRFKDSLRLDDDVEIIEPLVETIIVEDGSPECIISETIDITAVDGVVDDDVEFVGYSTIPKFKNSEIDDILCCTRSEALNYSDCEIVDVDNIIAESDAVLQRFKKKNMPSSIVISAPPLIPELGDMESQLQLTNLDIANRSSSPPFIEFLEPVPQHNPSLSSDPVMASTSTGANETVNCQSISGVIGNYFKNNPVTAKRTNYLGNVSSTIGNILEHMTNLLVGNPFTNSENVTNTGGDEYRQHGNVPTRHNIQWVNNYANRFTVADTVNLDDVQPSYLPSAYPSTSSTTPSFPQTAFFDPKINCLSQGATHTTPTEQRNEAPTPEPTSNENKGFGRTMECPICMESLSSRPLASTICGHIFCMACIQKAVSAPGGKKCPTCRKTFNKKGQSFHPLFL